MATLARSSRSGPTFSIVSILSIVAAFLSFRFDAAGGLLMAVLAIVLGAIGAVIAMLPGKRGGIMSMVAIVAGAIGIIAAFIKLLSGNVF
jgi:hypothetical protein